MGGQYAFTVALTPNAVDAKLELIETRRYDADCKSASSESGKTEVIIYNQQQGNIKPDGSIVF